MAENKTKPTDASVEDYIASRANAQQCGGPASLVMAPTGTPTRVDALGKPLWRALPSLLSKLGKHKMGKSCLYFKRLADLDRSALEKLVIGSIAEIKRRYVLDDGA